MDLQELHDDLYTFHVGEQNRFLQDAISEAQEQRPKALHGLIYAIDESTSRRKNAFRLYIVFP